MAFIRKTLITLIVLVVSVFNNSFATIYTKHAKDRMMQRGLIGTDIERTLEIGDIFESKGTFEDYDDRETVKYVAIDQLREIAVVFNPYTKVVITAMREATEKWFTSHGYTMSPIKTSTTLQDEKDKNTRNILAFGKQFRLSKNKHLSYDPSTQIAVFSNRSGVTRTTLIFNPSITNKGRIFELVDKEPLENVRIEKTTAVKKLTGLSGKEALENYYN